MKHALVLLLLAAVSCAPSAQRTSKRDARIESWRTVDAAPLNSRIDDAAAAGKEWTRSPLRAAIELLNAGSEVRTLHLHMEGNRIEAPDTVIIIMTRDGFADDSVRGDWNWIALHRLKDSTWRIHELRRAFRCWRGGNVESYAAEWCP